MDIKELQRLQAEYMNANNEYIEALQDPGCPRDAIEGWRKAKEEAEQRINAALSEYDKNLAASVLGSMTSERKQASSRENGKKGGRPRKVVK